MHSTFLARHIAQIFVELGVTTEDKDPNTVQVAKRDVIKCFLFAKMVVIDEMSTLNHMVLSFTDFLEAIARVVDMMSRGTQRIGVWDEESEGKEVPLAQLLTKFFELTMFKSYGRMLGAAARKILAAKALEEGPKRLQLLIDQRNQRA